MSEKQIYDFSFFMPGQTVEAEIKVPISKRSVDKKGNVIPFVLKPITTERLMSWKKKTPLIKISKAEAVSRT